MLMSLGFCVGFEWLCLLLFRNAGSIKDGSALATGLLLGLILSPGSPWYIVLCCAFSAMVIGKHLYGGLGQNIFNPAIMACVMLLALRPDDISIFPAGPLMPAAILAGSAYLFYKKYITWHIPASFLASLGLLIIALHRYSSLQVAPVLIKPMAGWVFLGAFFMATEPVTSPVTRKGMLIYGLGAGLLTGGLLMTGYRPESILYAILVMNALTPIIDGTGFRERLELSASPAFMRGAPLAWLTGAIFALASTGFLGMVKELLLRNQ
jgi:electron transport complex protein RnfD